MICSKCENQNPVAARFCGSCGNRIPTNPKENAEHILQSCYVFLKTLLYLVPVLVQKTFNRVPQKNTNETQDRVSKCRPYIRWPISFAALALAIFSLWASFESLSGIKSHGDMSFGVSFLLVTCTSLFISQSAFRYSAKTLAQSQSVLLGYVLIQALIFIVLPYFYSGINPDDMVAVVGILIAPAIVIRAAIQNIIGSFRWTSIAVSLMLAGIVILNSAIPDYL